METTLSILLINLGACLLLMILGWVASLILRNVTVVDSLWGLGFVLLAWLTIALSNGYSGRQWLIAVLVTVWGLRLSIYLSIRNWGKGEDPRYNEWRQKSGDKFWLQSLFKVFILQALFMWVIAFAMQYAQVSGEPARLTAWDLFGLIVWLVGFGFEAIGDAQLAAFKADASNKGKVMSRGLWAYTRHPNYFGEALLWWGIFIITLATPSSWWTVISPVVITAVLLKMTGIPLTERLLTQRRPGYADYIRRTNSFVPWFPGKGEK